MKSVQFKVSILCTVVGAHVLHCKDFRQLLWMLWEGKLSFDPVFTLTNTVLMCGRMVALPERTPAAASTGFQNAGSTFPSRPTEPPMPPGTMNCYRTRLGRAKHWLTAGYQNHCTAQTQIQTAFATPRRNRECLASQKRLTPSFISYFYFYHYIGNFLGGFGTVYKVKH